MAGQAESAIDEAADELYGLPPEQFIAARDERVRAARAAGDRELAAALGALRKPTTGAWVVNLLARSQRELLDQLLSLGDELREAQRELQGAALRELATRRQRVVAALVQTARRVAAAAGHPISASTAFDVEQTLHSALADPEVAGQVCSGRLVHPVVPGQFAPGGFGLDATARTEPPPAAARPARRPPARTESGAGAGAATVDELQQARERRAEERRRAELERLQAEHEAARADDDAAESELRDAEQRLAAAEATRNDATARIESLQQQLQASQRDLHEASGEVREARRRRDVAARVRTGTADRLTRLAERLRRAGE
jgi:hypothetical protein